MSAHPAEVEPDRSLVYAEAGQADRPDGVLLKVGDAHDQPIRALESPLGMDLFVERNADYELELGQVYRVDAGHGWTIAGVAGRRPIPPTADEERAADRQRVERILEDLAR